MLYYLATPYSKYADGIEAAFEDAARLAGRLYKTGMVVYSPIAHTHPIAMHGGLDPLDHKLWLKFDEKMMAACDVILVATMEGWQESEGVIIEIGHFRAAGKPVVRVDPITLELTPDE